MKLTSFIRISLLTGTLFGMQANNAVSASTEDVELPDTLVTVLEEVNVTSVKQMSRLREQPEAATLLTRAQIEQAGALELRGISDVVPNFYMPEYGSRITSTIYVRGIGARMDNPSVGLNVVELISLLNFR